MHQLNSYGDVKGHHAIIVIYGGPEVPSTQPHRDTRISQPETVSAYRDSLTALGSRNYWDYKFPVIVL